VTAACRARDPEVLTTSDRHTSARATSEVFGPAQARLDKRELKKVVGRDESKVRRRRRRRRRAARAIAIDRSSSYRPCRRLPHWPPIA
jgi:hypothetical protein